MKKIIALMMLMFAIAVVSAQDIRKDVCEKYGTQIGVRELTGHNDGQMVACYLASTGLDEGYAWCAAFVNWTLGQTLEAPAILPKQAAWSPSWFPSERQLYGLDKGSTTPCNGDVFGLYFKSKKRIAHVGFVDKWPPNSDYCMTVEGNTNMAGSREGDGVYRKRRLKRQVHKVANWTSLQSSALSFQSSVNDRLILYHNG